MHNDLLTAQEVADILKIKKNTVYEIVKRGELPSSKVGKQVRISKDDVEEYLQGSKEIHIKPIKPSKIDMPFQQVSNIEIFTENNNYDKDQALVLCGQDIILDLIANYISTLQNMPNVFRSYMGSYNSLYALYQNKINIATSHLWDAETNEYNIPYIKKLLPGIPVMVIRLAGRVQGFYVKKGNPKGIVGWEDLKRKDISIINREKGSGTRILLDEKLKTMGIFGGNISGYYRECPSHLVTASTVAKDGADIGFGNEKGSQQVAGVDFIPLQNEWYDLIFHRENLTKPVYKAIIDYIASDEFIANLELLDGYDTSQTGKVFQI